MTLRDHLSSAHARHAMRTILVVAAICLAGLVLSMTLDDLIAPPSDRALATAVATGG